MGSFNFDDVKTTIGALKKQNDSGEPNEKSVKITNQIATYCLLVLKSI